MAPLLILLMIGLPWLGALLVWGAGDHRPRLQHTLAAAFALMHLARLPWHSCRTQTAGQPFNSLQHLPFGAYLLWPTAWRSSWQPQRR
jgi:hypothetical protein